YMPSQQYGLKGKAFLGESFYTAENPPFGANFTYYLKEGLKSKKQLRQDAEKKGTPKYPSKDELRAEAEEEEPAILLKGTGERGEVVRSVTCPVTEGFHRVGWDLRDSSIFLKARANEEYGDLFGPEGRGPLVTPGPYSAFLVKRVDGKETPITPTVKFNVV